MVFLVVGVVVGVFEVVALGDVVFELWKIGFEGVGLVYNFFEWVRLLF